MVRFRVLYLVRDRIESYRSQVPRKPPYILTRSHYLDGPEVSAESPYEVWQELRESPEACRAGRSKPMAVGDALEADGLLLVCNYWGFDPAQWRVAASSASSV